MGGTYADAPFPVLIRMTRIEGTYWILESEQSGWKGSDPTLFFLRHPSKERRHIEAKLSAPRRPPGEVRVVWQVLHPALT